jgi:hypothetical protein
MNEETFNLCQEYIPGPYFRWGSSHCEDFQYDDYDQEILNVRSGYSEDGNTIMEIWVYERHMGWIALDTLGSTLREMLEDAVVTNGGYVDIVSIISRKLKEKTWTGTSYLVRRKSELAEDLGQ